MVKKKNALICRKYTLIYLGVIRDHLSNLFSNGKGGWGGSYYFYNISVHFKILRREKDIKYSRSKSREYWKKVAVSQTKTLPHEAACPIPYSVEIKVNSVTLT